MKEISLSLMSCGWLQALLKKKKFSLVGYFPRNNTAILLTIMSSSSVDILLDSVYATQNELSKYSLYGSING